MKKLKYIFLICAFLLSAAAAGVFADSGKGSYTLLYDLKLINDSSISADEKLTYDCLAEVCMRIYTSGGVDGKADFYNMAVTAKMIPENASGNVSADTAASALMTAIGYGNIGRAGENMLWLSSIYELYDNVNIADSSAVSAGEFFRMAENALFTDSVTYDGKSYEKSDKTVLEKNFGIDTYDGILYTGEMLDKGDGCVSVGDRTYIAEKDFSEFAGRKVRAYIDDETVISIDASRYNNEVCRISVNDIEEFSKDSISYLNKNGKTVRKKISASAQEVYNGRLCSFDMNDLNPENGIITLIRTPGNAEYNVVFVNEYDVMVAGGVGGGIIYDYNSAGLNINTNDPSVETTLILDGEKTDINSIKKYDALMLSYTKDRKNLTIEIVRNTVSGMVSEISESYIKVGRKAYPATAAFKKYSKKLTVGAEMELILDKSGFAVGFRRAVSPNERYGYFMGMFIDESIDEYKIKLLTEEGEIKIFELASRVDVNGATVKDKRSADGVLATTFKTLVDCNAAGEKSTRIVKDWVYQLIVYKQNQEEKITYIDTAIEEPGKAKEDQLTMDAYIDGRSSTAQKRFKKSSMQFIDSFGIANDYTKMFHVPITDNVFDSDGNLDKAQRTSAQNDDYETVTTGFWKNDEDKAVVHGFSLSKGAVAKACVIYNTNVGARKEFSENDAPAVLITNIAEGINPNDDEIYYVLTGTENGTEKTYYIKKDEFGYYSGDAPADGEEDTREFIVPQTGDVMQFTTDKHGVAVNYIIRYNGKTGRHYYKWHTNDYWGQYGSIAGYVYSQDDNGLILTDRVEKPSVKIPVMKNSIKNTVYIYDLKEDAVTKGSTDNFVSCDDSSYGASRVYIRTSYGLPGMAVIFINGEED